MKENTRIKREHWWQNNWERRWRDRKLSCRGRGMDSIMYEQYCMWNINRTAWRWDRSEVIWWHKSKSCLNTRGFCQEQIVVCSVLLDERQSSGVAPSSEHHDTGCSGGVEVKLHYLMVRSQLQVPLRFTRGSIVRGIYWISTFVGPRAEHRRIESHSSNWSQSVSMQTEIPTLLAKLDGLGLETNSSLTFIVNLVHLI